MAFSLRRFRHEGYDYDIEKMIKAAELSDARVSKPGPAAGALDAAGAQTQENDA